MHTAYNTDLAAHTTRRTTPVPSPHQSALRRMRHLYSAGLPPQCLVKLQFRDRLCIDAPIVQQSLRPGFRCQVCRLVKLKPMDCLKHRFRSSQLLQSSSPAAVSAPGVLPAWPKICEHCLWPGCLTPCPRLPASLRHHLRAPRRVRRQHTEIAVPMLARRWYQCRNPIQKLTCAQSTQVMHIWNAINRGLDAFQTCLSLQGHKLRPKAGLMQITAVEP